MEAQPIVLLQTLLVPLFFQDHGPLLDMISIVLMMLALQWWAMLIKAYAHTHDKPENVYNRQSILGIVLVMVLVAVTHLPMMTDPAMIFVSLSLAIWFWKRGRDRTRTGLSDEQLNAAFKIGFGILLVVLFFAALSFSFAGATLSNQLLVALPVFFLSGMIALSFTRIGLIQQEKARHQNGGRKEKFGSWIVALTVTWIVVVLASIVLETVPLYTLLDALSGVGDLLLQGLEIALTYILLLFWYITIAVLGALIWIFHLLFGWLLPKGTQQTITKKAQTLSVAPPGHNGGSNTLVEIIIGILLVLAVILVVRLIQMRLMNRKKNNAEEEEEEREALNMGAILQQRRHERKQQRAEELFVETLDPTSTRAQYRGFLQSVATSNQQMQRHANETPAEYQARLLANMNLATGHEEASPTPPDLTILKELTTAYAQERYGGKHPDKAKQAFLQKWVPTLTQHIQDRAAARAAAQVRRSSSQNSTWGD